MDHTLVVGMFQGPAGLHHQVGRRRHVPLTVEDRGQALPAFHGPADDVGHTRPGTCLPHAHNVGMVELPQSPGKGLELPCALRLAAQEPRQDLDGHGLVCIGIVPREDDIALLLALQLDGLVALCDLSNEVAHFPPPGNAAGQSAPEAVYPSRTSPTSQSR